MAKVFTITEGLENMGALRSGGQGSVYKGKRMGAILSAVKLLPTPIHTENEDDKNFRDFQNEVEKLKKVNEDPNPNVVKIINSGLTESGSFPFIEMEYIEGPDLEDLLKAPHPAVFTIRETIKLATHMSNALAHCHKAGVKHGDIKSNNVKFNTDTGNYVLLDFGLAVMSDEQRRSSLRHAGAVEFMAPEQHEGKMLFQSDIYSFGIIVFELLAGVVPFPLISKAESNRNQVMLSHLEKSVPDLLELRRNRMPADWSASVQKSEMDVPAWLLDIVAKCLEKAPADRYANGKALHDAVCNHIERRPAVQTEMPVVIAESTDILALEIENELLRTEVDKYKQYFKSKMLFFVGSLLAVCILTAVIVSSVGVTGNKEGETNEKAIVTANDSLESRKKKSKDTVIRPKPVQKKTTPVRTKDGLINDVPEF
jgi:serine/threonine protein kinase